MCACVESLGVACALQAVALNKEVHCHAHVYKHMSCNSYVHIVNVTMTRSRKVRRYS